MDIFENDFIGKAHESSAQWARDLLSTDPSSWVILDTETTGLGDYDEVVQVAVIDGAGTVLLDNMLIKPRISIPERARSIHGISNEMVESAPRFTDVLPLIAGAISDKHVVIYNVEYDLRMLLQSGFHFDYLYGTVAAFDCAMKEYAKWYGDWDDYHGSFRWQRLPGGDHTALGDCKAVLALIKRMAGGANE